MFGWTLDVHVHEFLLATNPLILPLLYLVVGGKRDDELILPLNASLSVTLHQNEVSQIGYKDS